MPPAPRPHGPAHEKLRVLSLFAGIGGFDLGLERTGGFETVAVAEVDPYASRVLALRFPDAPNVGDVTEAEYPHADVICAGFPCQDISFAGVGAGLAGERSGLFREVVRAVVLVRPAYVILENVAALLGRGLDDVLRALAEVGYDAEWHCIPASAVGAPHRRDRIWIIAHPRGEQHEGDRAPLSGGIAAELSRANHVGDPGRAARERDAGEVSGAQAGERGARELDGHFPLGPEHASAGGGAGLVADAEGERRGEAGQLRHNEPEEWAPGGGEVVADASGAGLTLAWPLPDGSDGEQGGRVPAASGWWAVEPDVGRVAHGIPKRVDRLRCLGNAVVPQIPELIGNAILQSLHGPATVQQGGAGPVVRYLHSTAVSQLGQHDHVA